MISRIFSPLIAAVALMNCHPDPKINAFHIVPAAYCLSSDQKIHIYWNTSKGETTLEIKPDDAAPRKVASKGSVEIDPHDMVVTLTVNKGELHPHVVQPVHAVDHHSLNGLATQCSNEWVATDPTDFGGGASAFAAEAQPSVISNKCAPDAVDKATCHRRVKVIHGGITWEIPANSARDISASNASMTGPWVLEQELLSGEQCGDDSAKAALEVDLSLEIGCTKGLSYEQ